MFSTSYDRIKKLAEKIKQLEDRLMRANQLSLAEQKQIHDEIKRCKEELDLLERRTR